VSADLFLTLFIPTLYSIRIKKLGKVKFILIGLASLVLVSCNDQNKSELEIRERLSKFQETETVAENEYKSKQEEQSYFGFKKEVINNIEFEAYLKRPENLTIKTSDGKIIYIHKGNPADFEFIDFNGDSFKDIILSYPSNYLFQELLLFNPKSNSFEFIKSFSKYPSSKRIGKTNFYYSYHGNGCAQNDWESNLYQLKDTIILEKGKIKGLGCLENDSNGIYIYRINNGNDRLLRYIKRNEGYWNGKWEFMDKYWNKNYKRFE